MNFRDELKQRAAHRAVSYLKSGMVVGLGTGSTTRFALERLGELIRDGELQNIVGIPSSLQTAEISEKVGIPLTDFASHPVIDITIDGADEVDPALHLIKGGGGALLREKVIAQASRENIIIVDEKKLSDQLGVQWAVPIEVIPFAVDAVSYFLKKQGADPVLRKKENGEAYLTDQKNVIIDSNFGPIDDPEKLSAELNACAGIVEHGLFVGLATMVIVAGDEGVSELRRS